MADTVAGDKTHRAHAVIENVNADLKDSALAHLPSGKFAANATWLVLAVLAFNLNRAATLTGPQLVHIDVKKIGKIPDGGGWRVHGRAATTADKHRRAKMGYDYVHSMVDDHSRLAYSDIHDDEKVDTCLEYSPGSS